MSDGENGIIIESPIAALRRKVEILEEKVKNLERERDQRIKTELLLLERYEEARRLYLSGIELFKSSQSHKKDQ